MYYFLLYIRIDWKRKVPNIKIWVSNNNKISIYVVRFWIESIFSLKWDFLAMSCLQINYNIYITSSFSFKYFWNIIFCIINITWLVLKILKCIGYIHFNSHTVLKKLYFKRELIFFCQCFVRKQKFNLNDIKKYPEDKALYSLLVLHNLYWDCLEYSHNIHRGILIT